MAVVRQDNFDVIALDQNSTATPTSVAAHFLYKHSRPDELLGPGGATLLGGTKYEQIDERTVRVTGAEFRAEAEGDYTVKLEGARNNGFQTIFLGAIRDPILLSQLSPWIEWIEANTREKFPQPSLEIKIYKYGVNGVMGPLEPDPSLPKEVNICGQIRADTQELANQVASMVKFYFTHAAYPGQLATAGNFAWPFTPCEIPLGPLSEFCVYHIMHKTDPVDPQLFPVFVSNFAGSNNSVPELGELNLFMWCLLSVANNGSVAVEKNVNNQSASIVSPLNGDTNKKHYLVPEPADGTCYLGDVASVIRSKNSGPYQLTFDIIFPDIATYEKVKKTGLLTKDTVARLYQIPVQDVIVSLFFPQAMAYKATIKRSAPSGGFGETDTHASQQHVPFLYLPLPWPR